MSVRSAIKLRELKFYVLNILHHVASHNSLVDELLVKWMASSSSIANHNVLVAE